MEIFPLFSIENSHEDLISSLAFSNFQNSSEKILLSSASNDKKINIFDLSTPKKKPIFQYKFHIFGINKIKFSENNRMLISGGNDMQINIIDVEKQSLLRNFRTNSIITSLDMNFSNNILAVGTYDNSILLYDVRSRNIIVKMISHSEPITSVVFSKDSTVVFSGSYDSFFRVWDVFKFNCLKTISLENSPSINNINLMPNEEFVLLSAFNDNLNIINVINEKEIKKFSGHKHKKFLVDCGIYYDNNNNKNYIISGDEDGFLCCWDIKENNENPYKKKIIEGENCLSVLDIYNDYSNSNNNIIACAVNGDKTNSIYITKLKKN